MDSVIILFFENNRTISKFSFFLKISIANNSKVKSGLDWSMFLDLELSINSNFIIYYDDLDFPELLNAAKKIANDLSKNHQNLSFFTFSFFPNPNIFSPNGVDDGT